MSPVKQISQQLRPILSEHDFELVRDRLESSIIPEIERLETQRLLKEINELRSIGNTLFECETIDKIFEKVTPIIQKKLQAQVISLFLISKDNCLNRRKIWGFDKNQELITDDWLKNESYELGTSFSGKAANPVADKPYGETHFSNKLEQDVGKLSYGSEYIEKLGLLKCGISIPLNGIHRTIGTLEVLNKLDPNINKPIENCSFSEFDIYWLTIIGSHVASAIIRLRRKWEEKIVSDISFRLADPDNENPNLESAYDLFAKHLIHEFMPYKVCIIRLCFDNKSLQVISKAKTDDITWVERCDNPRMKSQGIVGEVLENKEPIIVENIEKNIDKFLNKEWIETQKKQGKPLKSFICYPLVIRNKVVGTISLFTGYYHKFIESELLFLKNISFQLAVFKTINNSFQEDYEQMSKNYKKSLKSIEQQYKERLEDKNKQIARQEEEIDYLNSKIKELDEQFRNIPIPKIGNQNNQKSNY